MEGGDGLGHFELNPGSLGTGAGKALPNFTFDIENTTLAAKSGIVPTNSPSIGAFESGASAMKFGIQAAQ